VSGATAQAYDQRECPQPFNPARLLLTPRLHGTAGHLLKIWVVLKHMGLGENAAPVAIDTGNSTDSLKRLFAFGDPDGNSHLPFAGLESGRGESNPRPFSRP